MPPPTPTPLLPSEYGSANSTGATQKFKNLTIYLRLTHTSTGKPNSSFINASENTSQQVVAPDRDIVLAYMSTSLITHTGTNAFSRAYPNKGGLYQEFDRRIVRAEFNFRAVDATATGNDIPLRINTVTIKANNLTAAISENNYNTTSPAKAWDTTRQRWYYQSESDQASRRLEPNFLGAGAVGIGDYGFNVTKLVQRAMANGHTPICFVIYVDTDGQFGLGGVSDDEILIISSENQVAGTDVESYPRLTTWSTTIKGPPRTRRHGIWNRSRAFV